MNEWERDRTGTLWLEIYNVRIDNDSWRILDQRVWVQVKGDKSDLEPTWWPVRDNAIGEDAVTTGRRIMDALEKKSVVLGRFRCVADLTRKAEEILKKAVEDAVKEEQKKPAKDQDIKRARTNAARDKKKKLVEKTTNTECVLWCTDIRIKYSDTVR